MKVSITEKDIIIHEDGLEINTINFPSNIRAHFASHAWLDPDKAEIVKTKKMIDWRKSFVTIRGGYRISKDGNLTKL